MRGRSHASGKGACVKLERWKRGFYDKSGSIPWAHFTGRSGVFIFSLGCPNEKSVHIQHRFQVGDTTLAPGDYTIIVDGGEATFEQGRKVVAKVSCAVKESGEKYSADSIVYANAAITEIRFAGQSQVITFAPITTSNPSKSPSTSSGDR